MTFLLTFSCLEELESLLEEGEESYKQGKYKPWSEAFADIKSRYSL